MTTEQYSIGYDEGYQDGWNAAMDAKPASKPLTDEEISDIWCRVSNTDFVTVDTHEFARAIEAKLKQKNQ